MPNVINADSWCIKRRILGGLELQLQFFMKNSLNPLFSDGPGKLHSVRLHHFFCGILSSLYAAKWSSGAIHSALIAAICAEAAVALVNE